MNNLKRFVVYFLAVTMIMLFFVGCEDEKASASSLQYTLTQDGNCYEVTAPRENNLTTQSITVPSTYEGKPIVIASRAFYGLPELISVTVEDTTGEIGTQAFMNCPKLETVILQGNATVASKCFSGCQSLKSIAFGRGIQSVGMECVFDCPALETVDIGDDCKSIGAKAFQNCHNLKTVTLGSGLEQIGAYAFAHTEALTKIQFPTVKPLSLEDYAFSYSGLKELHIPANAILGEYVFDHLSWDSIKEYSRCKAVYFYSTAPTVENLGTNSIGYTWDRTEEDDPELGAFLIYVPEDVKAEYIDLMSKECDESWTRCVLNLNKLATFNP